MTGDHDTLAIVLETWKVLTDMPEHQGYIDQEPFRYQGYLTGAHTLEGSGYGYGYASGSGTGMTFRLRGHGYGYGSLENCGQSSGPFLTTGSAEGSGFGDGGGNPGYPTPGSCLVIDYDMERLT